MWYKSLTDISEKCMRLRDLKGIDRDVVMGCNGKYYDVESVITTNNALILRIGKRELGKEEKARYTARYIYDSAYIKNKSVLLEYNGIVTECKIVDTCDKVVLEVSYRVGVLELDNGEKFVGSKDKRLEGGNVWFNYERDK